VRFLPTKNPKFHTKEVVEWNSDAGVVQPDVKFFKDPACSVKQDWAFPLVDRGSVAELQFYLKSDKTMYGLKLKAQGEPDRDWPGKKSSVGPMLLQVEPESVEELKAGHVLSGKLIWNIPDDEQVGKRQASVLLQARFAE